MVGPRQVSYSAACDTFIHFTPEAATLLPHTQLPTMINADPGPAEGGDGGGLVTWDGDAIRLLKMVDTENLTGLQTLLSSGIQVNGHGGSFHETALHRAAQVRWAAGMRYLISAGASVYAKNQFGQTPLHYAAASKSSTCIKLLLECRRPGVVDHRDMRGHTPLHDAASSGCVNAITMLLKAGALVRAKDGNGNTPLHKAAHARSVPCMVLLLNAGGDMSAVDNNGESVLAYTLHYLPGTMDAVFDECLTANSSKINTKTLEVSMNFLPLTCSDNKNQVQNLSSFVDLGHAKLLSHPLCETFLLLKWMNVRRLFLIEVVLYLLFAVLTTVLTFNKFVWTTSNTTIVDLEREKGEEWREWAENHATSQWGVRALPVPAERVLKGIIVTYLVFILLQQLLSLLQNKLAWFRSLSGVLHVVITVLVMTVVLPPLPEEWQHHLASWLMLLMWTECMLLIGRFPNCGVYVVMFTRVAKVFLRIFLMYFCLLLAFSAAFYVALHYRSEDQNLKNAVFSNPILTFVKTLTMMTGELDFSEDFVDGLSHLVFTGHAIFLFFIIIISIILSNLLVALAVNDVQGLRNSAHLERLIKQTELVFHMEKNFSTAAYLATHIKVPKLNDLLMKVAHVCNYDCYNTRIFFLPNNPKKSNKLFIVQNKKFKETKIPSHLLANVNQCLRNREAEHGDSKTSTKAKRGSRIRRGDYHREGNEEMKVNLKELEANVIEIVSEKIEEMGESYSTLNKQMVELEEKINQLTSLLQLRLRETVSVAGGGGQGQSHPVGTSTPSDTEGDNTTTGQTNPNKFSEEVT